MVTRGVKRRRVENQSDKRLAIPVSEAAERLSLSRRTIRRMIADGRLPVIRLSTRKLLIDAAVLQQIVAGEVA